MERYEIQIVGHIEPRRARSLGCEGVRPLATGRSVLTYEATDQAALYGLLARLRDLGIELVALRRGEEPVSFDEPRR
jgi:hypothetical protein